MIPASFDYVRPSTLDEALKAIANNGAKVLAGGQSLLPLMKLRLAEPGKLIDIGRIGELKGIDRPADGSASIRALTTYRELRDNTPVDWVRDAIDGIADVQVRNRGTIGGAIAHADPASDFPAIALAFDAEVVLRSSSGERVVAMKDFLKGPFQTDIRPDEILVAVRRPPMVQGAGGAYERLEQPASGFSIVGVAAILGHSHGVYGSSTIDHVRVAITGVGEVAYRATAVEEALTGTDCSPDRIAAAAAKACEGVTVNSDIHADAEYRAAMAVVYTRRALEKARARSS
jgi:carbon-monoxide dehydrogenase medium subunit